MASFGRSLKPSTFLPRGRRPQLPGRTMSNSSDVSEASSGAPSEDQFVLSRGNTPVSEQPPPAGSTGISTAPSAPLPENQRKDQPFGPSISRPTGNPASGRSRPIAIELPRIRKINTAPVCTPPEPLSARGDIPGGYFPLHEDPISRVHRPHPFHIDQKRAHPQSFNPSTEYGGPVVDHNPPAIAMSVPSAPAALLSHADPSQRSNTPVTSYLPLGLQDNPLPMGKYYPSNYESKRSSEKLRPPTSNPPPSSVKSDSQVPMFRSSASPHSSPRISPRPDSDAQRRLLQYQRDMIAQATMAASQLLGAGNRRGISGIPAASLNASIRNMHLGGRAVHRPISPRLHPLGSPGPVTPMELEGGGDGGGYLTMGRPSTGFDLDRQSEEVAGAMRAEDERKLREGATSPIVEIGPITF